MIILSLQVLNFFDPDIEVEGEPYKHFKYKQIINEQVAISYASKGISISDTDELCPYDRKLVLEALIGIKDKEREEIEKSYQNRSASRK